MSLPSPPCEDVVLAPAAEHVVAAEAGDEVAQARAGDGVRRVGALHAREAGLDDDAQRRACPGSATEPSRRWANGLTSESVAPPPSA